MKKNNLEEVSKPFLTINYIKNWIKEELKKNKKQGILVLLEPNLQSYLLSYVAKKYFPKNYKTIIIKFSKKVTPETKKIYQICIDLDLNFQEYDFSKEMRSISKKIEISDITNFEVIKQNLNKTLVFAFCKKLNYIFLNSSFVEKENSRNPNKPKNSDIEILPFESFKLQDLEKVSQNISKESFDFLQ